MKTIYPLDKIYSDNVGVTYPVCGAKSSDTPEPTPDQTPDPTPTPDPEPGQ